MHHPTLADCASVVDDFCDGKPAPGSGKRVLQASPTGACDFSTIAAEVVAVAADCCDGQGDACGPVGVATTCDAKCAASFISFFDRCGKVLQDADATRVGAYRALYDTCHDKLPLLPLIEAAARCDGIATGTDF